MTALLNASNSSSQTLDSPLPSLKFTGDVTHLNNLSHMVARDPVSKFSDKCGFIVVGDGKVSGSTLFAVSEGCKSHDYECVMIHFSPVILNFSCKNDPTLTSRWNDFLLAMKFHLLKDIRSIVMVFDCKSFFSRILIDGESFYTEFFQMVGSSEMSTRDSLILVFTGYGHDVESIRTELNSVSRSFQSSISHHEFKKSSLESELEEIRRENNNNFRENRPSRDDSGVKSSLDSENNAIGRLRSCISVVNMLLARPIIIFNGQEIGEKTRSKLLEALNQTRSFLRKNDLKDLTSLFDASLFNMQYRLALLAQNANAFFKNMLRNLNAVHSADKNWKTANENWREAQTSVVADFEKKRIKNKSVCNEKKMQVQEFEKSTKLVVAEEINIAAKEKRSNVGIGNAASSTGFFGSVAGGAIAGGVATAAATVATGGLFALAGVVLGTGLYFWNRDYGVSFSHDSGAPFEDSVLVDRHNFFSSFDKKDELKNEGRGKYTLRFMDSSTAKIPWNIRLKFRQFEKDHLTTKILIKNLNDEITTLEVEMKNFETAATTVENCTADHAVCDALIAIENNTNRSATSKALASFQELGKKVPADGLSSTASTHGAALAGLKILAKLFIQPDRPILAQASMDLNFASIFKDFIHLSERIEEVKNGNYISRAMCALERYDRNFLIAKNMSDVEEMTRKELMCQEALDFGDLCCKEVDAGATSLRTLAEHHKVPLSDRTVDILAGERVLQKNEFRFLVSDSRLNAIGITNSKDQNMIYQLVDEFKAEPQKLQNQLQGEYRQLKDELIFLAMKHWDLATDWIETVDYGFEPHRATVKELEEKIEGLSHDILGLRDYIRDRSAAKPSSLVKRENLVALQKKTFRLNPGALPFVPNRSAAEQQGHEKESAESSHAQSVDERFSDGSGLL